MDLALPGLPDRFQLLTEVGQSGMATVDLAEDRVAHVQVALKIIHPHLRRNELVVERFRREIAAARRVQHDNVVAIHDLIENDELICLVLEWPAVRAKRARRR